MNRIVLDTETANSLEEPLAYDIGWAVIDENGEPLARRSYAVAEVFLDKNLMTSAYYAEKLPAYWEDIKANRRILAPLRKIVAVLRNDIAFYGITEVYAHNARFDDLSTKLTERYLTGSRYRYFFPKNITIYDTLKMARKAFGENPAYCQWCENNGFMTKHLTPRPRYTAEVLYRFMTQDINFQEVHQGLADVEIERQILMYCLDHGIEPMALWGD